MPLVHQNSLKAIHLELLLVGSHDDEGFGIGIRIQHILAWRIVGELR